jgi:hypothetical protein
VNNVLASRQHVYGRNLRFCWFGSYDGILSVMAFYEKVIKVKADVAAYLN